MISVDHSLAGAGHVEVTIRAEDDEYSVDMMPTSEYSKKLKAIFTPAKSGRHAVDVRFNRIKLPGVVYAINLFTLIYNSIKLYSI